ncbi:hypothetical protein Tco_1210480 [Tanacetum coccineum]
MQEKKPDVSFFHVFGALCYPTNDNDDLGKLDTKADVAMASEQFSSGPGLQCIIPTTSSSGLVPNTVSQQPCIPPLKDDWDRLFQLMFDEYFTPLSIADAPSSSTPSTQEQEQSPNISQDTPMIEKSKLDEDLQGTLVDATLYHAYRKALKRVKLGSFPITKGTFHGSLKALDDALVSFADRLEFGKCNMRLKNDIKPKEATFQVVLDALALTLFYHAFLITADVPAIYIDLGHTRDITYLTDVNVNYLHQQWRAFSTIINKCLSGKETRMDQIHLLFQIEYKDAKKSNKMSYPRFTKIIINYFMSKDLSISRRNKMFWHTARDDTLFTSMRCISRHEDTQAPKPKYIRKKTDSDTSPKKNHVQAIKGTRLKSKLSSGDGVNTQLKVPDEQQQKTSSTDEEIGTIPGVPDVPPYESVSDKESWGDSEDKDDNDDDGDNDDNGESDNHDDDKEDVDDRVHTPSDYELIDDEKLDDEETMDDEEDDEVIKELYDDVNVKLGNNDTEMTVTDQGALEQQNVSQESGFEQEGEDTHLLNLENPYLIDNEIASLLETSAHHPTRIPEITSSFTTTTPPPTPFFNPLLQQQTPTFTTTNSINATITLPEIPNFASVFKFEQRVSALESEMSKLRQTNQFAEAVSLILGIVDTYLASKMKEAVDVDSTMKTTIKDHVKAQVSKIMPKIEKYASLSEFELKKILIDKMEANKSINRSENQKNHYNPLIESYNSDKSVHAKEPSHTVEDSGMQQDQEFFMGDNDEQPADKEVTKVDWFKKPERPPTPDPNWSKRQQVNFRPPQTWISQAALAEEPPTLFDEFNDTSFDFFAFSSTELEYHLEECFKATTKRLDWHNSENKPYPFNLRKPLPLIQDHRGRQIIPKDYFINKDLEYLKGGDLSRRYSTSVTKTKATTYELKWIEDLGPKRQSFYIYASNLTSSKDVYSRRRIIAVTRLTIMKKYDYGYLEEIDVRRDDQQLYTFKEGDFKRLRLQDIEDMLLLLVQQKLTNLTIDERYHLNVALRMFTRRIVIQRRVEDLQLGVKSYQKKLNLTKPDTYRSNLKNKTAYTSHSDPHGIIYVDQFKRKRLMRTDELHKFSDGMLNDV